MPRQGCTCARCKKYSATARGTANRRPLKNAALSAIFLRILLRIPKISGAKIVLEPLFPTLLHIVSFLELVYTAACINELLPACKEGVALIADIHLERFNVFGGTRLKGFAASAYNRYFVIFRMYIGLHFIHLALDFNAKLLYIIIYGQSIIFPPAAQNNFFAGMRTHARRAACRRFFMPCRRKICALRGVFYKKMQIARQKLHFFLPPFSCLWQKILV